MPQHSPRPTAGRRKRLALHQPTAGLARGVPVPPGLPEAEQAVWARYAPAAERMQTLTPETIEGFRLLCQVTVLRDVALAQVQAEGLTFVAPSGEVKAHPLCVHVRQLTQRIEALMAKFALLAPGRAVEVPSAAAAGSKWDRLLRPSA